MKTAINKEFTTITKADTVKNALKKFKANYNESDVIAWFENCTGKFVYGDILEMKVSGFDGFECVCIVVECIVYNRGIRFYDIRFHADITEDGFMLKVDNNELLTNIRTFI